MKQITFRKKDIHSVLIQMGIRKLLKSTGK